MGALLAASGALPARSYLQVFRYLLGMHNHSTVGNCSFSTLGDEIFKGEGRFDVSVADGGRGAVGCWGSVL